MKTVFVVDDNETNLVAARQALGMNYKVYALNSAGRMFKLLSRILPDFILLDVDMPEMDGFQALEMLKKDERLKVIPVMFLTARLDAESEMRGFEIGALDFISKPFSPLVLVRRIEAHLKIDGLIKSSVSSLKEAYSSTISSIASLVDRRDEVTGGHSLRVQSYLEVLVNQLAIEAEHSSEITSWDLTALISSGQLHDMGKIVVSDTILNKNGKLTDEEYEKIKTHSLEGEKLINKIISEADASSFLIHAKKFAGSHHEKYNGTGYPRGLKGDEIPLEGRIMAIVDVYDALVSERPYKKSFSHEDAVEIIKNDSGIHFDPNLVEVFIKISEDFWALSVST